MVWCTCQHDGGICSCTAILTPTHHSLLATSTVPFAARQLIEKFAELRWQRRLQDLLSVGAEYRAERVDDEMVSLAGFIG